MPGITRSSDRCYNQKKKMKDGWQDEFEQEKEAYER